jgi:hypothetical protein
MAEPDQNSTAVTSVLAAAVLRFKSRRDNVRIFRASRHWFRFMSLLAPHLGGRQGLDVADLMFAPKRRCCDIVKQAQPD